jgi:hypothetical protein
LVRKFHYSTGEDVRIGDQVKYTTHPGEIHLIILPDTADALDLQCPEGGVDVAYVCSGVVSHFIYQPPDGDYWEDLYFIGRG